MHFFLDIRRKEPYKGDTSALRVSGAKFDVKGESIDEERNQEESARQEEACSEEEKVGRAGSFEFKPSAPSDRGRFYLERKAKRCARSKQSPE
jgi:hypothetical protein